MQMPVDDAVSSQSDKAAQTTGAFADAVVVEPARAPVQITTATRA
jgi:hypothetical protein